MKSTWLAAKLGLLAWTRTTPRQPSQAPGRCQRLLWQGCLPGDSAGENLFAVQEIGGTSAPPGWGGSPAKEMATDSSTLAWRVPWVEAPGGYSPWVAGSDTAEVTEHTRTHVVAERQPLARIKGHPGAERWGPSGSECTPGAQPGALWWGLRAYPGLTHPQLSCARTSQLPHFLFLAWDPPLQTRSLASQHRSPLLFLLLQLPNASSSSFRV